MALAHESQGDGTRGRREAGTRHLAHPRAIGLDLASRLRRDAVRKALVVPLPLVEPGAVAP